MIDAHIIASSSAARGNTWGWGSAGTFALEREARDLARRYEEALEHHRAVTEAVAERGFGAAFAPQISARAARVAWTAWQDAQHRLRCRDPRHRTIWALVPRTVTR